MSTSDLAPASRLAASVAQAFRDAADQALILALTPTYPIAYETLCPFGPPGLCVIVSSHGQSGLSRSVTVATMTGTTTIIHTPGDPISEDQVCRALAAWAEVAPSQAAQFVRNVMSDALSHGASYEDLVATAGDAVAAVVMSS
jgi:hypothetical protein